jgi:hypothetical protein
VQDGTGRKAPDSERRCKTNVDAVKPRRDECEPYRGQPSTASDEEKSCRVFSMVALASETGLVATLVYWAYMTRVEQRQRVDTAQEELWQSVNP